MGQTIQHESQSLEQSAGDRTLEILAKGKYLQEKDKAHMITFNNLSNVKGGSTQLEWYHMFQGVCVHHRFQRTTLLRVRVGLCQTGRLAILL